MTVNSKTRGRPRRQRNDTLEQKPRTGWLGLGVRATIESAEVEPTLFAPSSAPPAPPRRRRRRLREARVHTHPVVEVIGAEGFATPREAAHFLGVGKTWMYELCQAGGLTHIRHGNRICIPWSVIYKYAQARCKRGTIV